MRSLILSILLVFVVAGSGFAQRTILNKDTSRFSRAPLFVIKSSATGGPLETLPTLDLIDQADIAGIEVLKDKLADSLYGFRGRYGVVILTLVTGVNSFTKNQLLDHYNIKEKDRSLPLYVDDNLVFTNNRTVFTLKTIKSLNIAQDTETGLNYINLISTVYPKLKFMYKNATTVHKN